MNVNVDGLNMVQVIFTYMFKFDHDMYFKIIA